MGRFEALKSGSTSIVNLDKFDIGVKHHKEEKRKILKLVRKASSVLREDKQKVDTEDADGPLNTEEFEELKHFESWERLLNLGKRDSHLSGYPWRALPVQTWRAGSVL